MQRQAQLTPAERQLLPLLEREYREDIRSYMYEMQVRRRLRIFRTVSSRARTRPR